MENAGNQRPVLSYLICATHRSGSELLCDLLRNTRLAGWPAEYYLPRAEAERYHEDGMRRKGGQPHSVPGPNGPGGNSLRMHPSYLARILRSRMTRNGVFGMKVMQSYFGEFVEWLGETGPMVAGRPGPEILATVFPNLRYVHLSRRDKARQAVSLIKARDTKAYGPVNDDQSAFAEPFRFELMDQQVAELERQDDGWRQFFAAAGISPVQVTYEELVERPGEVVADLLRRLGIGVPDDLSVGGTRLRRQADAANEAWVSRYWQVRRGRSVGCDSTASSGPAGAR